MKNIFFNKCFRKRKSRETFYRNFKSSQELSQVFLVGCFCSWWFLGQNIYAISVSLELWSWTFVWNFSSNNIWFITNYNDKVFRAGLVWCIAAPIHLRVDSSWVDLSQGRFIAGSICYRVNSSQSYVNWKLDWNVKVLVWTYKTVCLAMTKNFIQLNEPCFMFKPKIIHFNQVDFSKTSFTVAPSGDEGPSFVCPAKELTYHCD
jgi:hypothetical protein